MDDVQQNHHDDFEAHIVPIPSLGSETPMLRPGKPRRPRLSSKQRNIILQVSVVLNLLLLIVLVLPGSVPALRNMATGIYTSLIPPATPTLPPGSDKFYIDVNAPWTNVFIDGHPVHVPRITSQPPLTLTRGRHVIQWNANPFQPQSCIIVIPHTNDDTCSLTSTGRYHSISPTQLLLLHESLDTLPDTQRKALFDAAQMALKQYHPSEMVRPGELYRGMQGYVTATQPLQATLHFQMDIRMLGNETYVVTLQGCQALCSLPWPIRQSPSSPLPSTKWLALAVISSSWDYATEDGHVIAQNQHIDLSGSVETAHPILLAISWENSTWKVEALFSPNIGPAISIEGSSFTDDPACVAAQNLLLGTLPHPSQARLISGSNPAAGCLAVVTNGGENTPTPAYYLERFGVLLAVNSVAHLTLPQLPVADAYEQSLAQQLMTLPGQMVDIP